MTHNQSYGTNENLVNHIYAYKHPKKINTSVSCLLIKLNSKKTTNMLILWVQKQPATLLLQSQHPQQEQL
jgi:hypothetical protein